MDAPSPIARGSRDVRRQRRRAVDLAVTGLLAIVVAAVLALLVWVLAYVAIKGAKVIGWGFFTSTPPGNPADTGGGFENGIVGSLIIVGLATAMSVPLGVAAAVYLAEYGEKRLAAVVRFLADVMLGIPSIVTGAFVYSLWVLRFGFSGYAGAIALGLVMFPLVIRASEEMLRLVPDEHREASLAVGAGRAKTTVFVVLPIALSGITTGVMLAVARAMGETAPLLLTALGNDLFLQTNPGERMSTLSLQIFGNAITGFRESQARAWGGALTLIGIVLIFTIVARLAGRRSVVTAR
jgi:phosphate transport system permease protein